jgi:hypothetical protein
MEHHRGFEFRLEVTRGLAKSCNNSVYNSSSSRQLFKTIKIKICGTITLPILLYWCETCSLTLREKYTVTCISDYRRGLDL